MIDGGSAADHGSGGNVVRDAALGYGYGAVSDFYVAADAYLAGQDHVVAYVGGARQAYLGAEQRVLSDGAAVAYMDEVVDFCAASDAGFAYAGSVDAGIGLDFGFALDGYVSGLEDFVPVVRVVLGEAEAVGAYDRAVLQDDVVSETAEFADYGMRVGEEIVAYGGSAINDYVRQEWWRGLR
jgi:hypothetical protein